MGEGKVGPGVVLCLDQCDALAMQMAHARTRLTLSIPSTSVPIPVQGGGNNDVKFWDLNDDGSCAAELGAKCYGFTLRDVDCGCDSG